MAVMAVSCLVSSLEGRMDVQTSFHRRAILKVTSRPEGEQKQWNALLELCVHCSVAPVFFRSLGPVEALQL